MITSELVRRFDLLTREVFQFKILYLKAVLKFFKQHYEAYKNHHGVIYFYQYFCRRKTII